MALLGEADALLQEEDYQQASALYAKAEEGQRDFAWRYHYHMCQLQLTNAEASRAALEVLSQDKSAGVYASLASLELADRKAKQLLKDYP